MKWEKNKIMKNFKLYLKDKKTGEVQIKYICKDCGLEMDEPENYIAKAKDGLVDPFTAEFRCDNCYAKFKEQFKRNNGRSVVRC